ncbi:MAG: YicC family protein [Saccharospirillaceae bacterium]|nr:YicC family protein [Saccharospirillaceae bacterium]MCD8531503.1 YicC family protein [Saccharospirillaceae bacterium]
MVFSMTAFARASSESTQGRFTWEIRSVNSRYLELHFRLPDAFRDLEPALRERLRTSLNRGKVECALRFQPLQGESKLSVNHELVHELNRAADEVHALLTPKRSGGPGNAMNVLDVLAWPGVISSAETDGKALQQAALQAFDDCLHSTCDARQREGEELAALIRQRLEKMQQIVAAVSAAMPQALAAQRQQLEDKIAELNITLDSNRLETEMVLLAQKADVAEELDRLNTHIQEVGRILSQNEPIGRRLDFMMQELNREANTLSSKSLTTGITQAAVDLKVLIEQMREQVQNIE